MLIINSYVVMWLGSCGQELRSLGPISFLTTVGYSAVPAECGNNTSSFVWVPCMFRLDRLPLMDAYPILRRKGPWHREVCHPKFPLFNCLAPQFLWHVSVTYPARYRWWKGPIARRQGGQTISV